MWGLLERDLPLVAYTNSGKARGINCKLFTQCVSPAKIATPLAF